MNAILQIVLYTVLLIALAVPYGRFMSRAMEGEKTIFSRVLGPCERGIYKLMRIDPGEQMSWKKYAGCAVAFSALSLFALWAMFMLQGGLPWNPQGIEGTSWHLGFNTAASFVTNTNWQSYSGESALSYFSQAIGLTVQNFVTPAVALAVLFALIRGFRRVQKQGLGSFWADVTRAVVYVLLPLNLVIALALVSQGVMTNLKDYQVYELVEPATVQQEDGTEITVTRGIIPMGPQASQVAIKQSGTNGGGYNGVNSASPLENPTPLSNLIEMISLLLIPAACCFAFGRSIRDKRQGRALFLAMLLLLVAALGVVAVMEQNGTPQLAQDGAVSMAPAEGYPGGNMEGKETRFGIAASATWAVYTTAASNGSVNCMHDSLTPLGGMAPMLLMQLGEVVFGGVGCGLYGMIGFAILAVFIAGLMVGRTPEYLGKKIEPFEMRMAVLVCLATPLVILIGSCIATLLPATADSLNNGGAHGLSEVLYAYSSAGGNNGSAFAGFNANTPFLNVSIGLVMLAARFLPMIATLAIAGSMVQKKRTAVSAGTLSTTNAMFVGLLIFIVVLVGALSFFPALSLGPIAEFTQMLA